jgi:hypothetical protein
MKSWLLRLLKAARRAPVPSAPPPGSFLAAMPPLKRGAEGQNLTLLALQHARALRGKPLLCFKGMGSVEDAYLRLGPKGSFRVRARDEGIWVTPVGDKAKRYYDEVTDELARDAFYGERVWKANHFGGSTWRRSLTKSFELDRGGQMPEEVAQSLREALLHMPAIP